MNYWLLKSEPGTWSWDDQSKVKKEMWDGVRNYQARNNLMKMIKGDLCFFYHSVNEKKIVGIAEVVKEHYPDPTDKTNRFVVVDFKTNFSFIDLGCGNGWTISKLRENNKCYQAIGIDGAKNLILKANIHNKGTFIKSDIDSLSARSPI